MRTLFINVVLIILLLGYVGSLLASEPDTSKYPKQLQVNAGYYNLGSIDEIYSYNLYSGSDFCSGLKYTYGKRPVRQIISIRFSTINRRPHSLTLDENLVDSDARERILNSFLAEAFYTCQYPIELKGADYLRFWVTGTWLTTVNITSNSYGTPELVQSGLAPGAFLETNFKRHNFHYQLSIPIVSWTLRNSYSQSMTQNFEKINTFDFIRTNDQLQFPNTLLAVYSNIGYVFTLSNRFNIECEYDFRYTYNSSPRKLESVSGIYSFGLTYKF